MLEKMPQENKLIAIIGPTAGGKTSVAANLAYHIDGEIISADSRQIYRGMDLGTGKDIVDYTVNGKDIPYHLIDIVDAGYKYNVFEYQADFLKAYNDIKSRNKVPVLCGGTGMYVEAVTLGYKLINVPVDDALRASFENMSDEELTALLKTKKSLHNTSDINTRKRLVRALEIAIYEENHPDEDYSFPKIETQFFGVKYDRESRRKRITERLKERLKTGMVEEVEMLIKQGVSPEDLIYYGLEYKFLTQYVTGEINYNDMFQRLNTAIHQFAKRQMTWFRRMERNGAKIKWLDGYMPMEEKMDTIMKMINE